MYNKIRFLEIPFLFSLKSIPTLDISQRTPLTSKSLSTDWLISWVIASKWLTQEFHGINPDWFGKIKLFSVKKGEHFVIKERSKTLVQKGSKETGL